ncbi:hypothetical protein D3C73_648210 [compost metagenome]
MVDHQIHNQLHTAGVKSGKQFLPVSECAEIIHDTLIIADIIAVIVIGRLVYRTQPDHVDA